MQAAADQVAVSAEIHRREPESWPRRLAPWALAVTVIFILSSPLILTDRTFVWDWSARLWLLASQTHSLSEHGFPTLFISAATDPVLSGPSFNALGRVFEPHFAFDSGTLNVIFGYPGVVIGASNAYVLAWICGLAMYYGGATWIGRQLGLGRWTAQLPALVVVCSPYVLTNMYSRGDINEFMATAAMPLMIASGLWLVRNDRWRLLPVAALIFSTTVWAGSHVLTVILGGAGLLLAGLITLALCWPRVRQIGLRRLAAVCGLGALGIGINAWYLIPLVAFQSRTFAGKLSETEFLTPAGHLPTELFNWLPRYPESLDPQMSVSLPVAIAAWCLAAAAVLVVLRRLTRAAILWVVMTTLVTAGLVHLILSPEPWDLIPWPFDRIQFTYRLETYIAFLVATLTGIFLAGFLRTRRALRVGAVAALGGILAVLLFVDARSIWRVPTQTNFPPQREYTFAENRQQIADNPMIYPRTQYGAGVWSDVSEPVMSPTARITIDPMRASGSSFEGDFEIPPGTTLLGTNIGGGPYLVGVDGAEPVGRDTQDYMVLAVPPGTTTLHLKLYTARTAPVIIGRVVSLASLAGTAVVLILVAFGSRRRRRTVAGQLAPPSGTDVVAVTPVNTELPASR